LRTVRKQYVSKIVLRKSRERAQTLSIGVLQACYIILTMHPHESEPLLFAIPTATAVPIQNVVVVQQPQVVVMNRQAVQEHVVYNSVIEDYLINSQGLLVREKQWLVQIACTFFVALSF
jgi:hypothetical protein